MPSSHLNCFVLTPLRYFREAIWHGQNAILPFYNSQVFHLIFTSATYLV